MIEELRGTEIDALNGKAVPNGKATLHRLSHDWLRLQHPPVSFGQPA
jgi:hypothetical protein